MSEMSQEHYEIEQADNTVDEISKLPDAILVHIMSFMSTKDVVKTSILSKRWNHLWTLVPNLDFDDTLLDPSLTLGRNPPPVSCFTHFVDRVLWFRYPSDLQRFQLSCGVYLNELQINRWITAAIVSNVKELVLSIITHSSFEFTSCLFCCTSLTSLKIKLTYDLELPTKICFPNLKTFCLSRVRFPDDESTQKLFAGCPVLEELVLLDCDWTNLKNITISSSTLNVLTIDDLPCFGLFDTLSDNKITIHAPNLVCFKYMGFLSHQISLRDASSLFSAYVNVISQFGIL